MQREDFKEITPKHIKIAKRIVKQDDCVGTQCIECPLSSSNKINNHSCSGVDYSARNAKKFLKLFDEPKEKSLNFYERLSATIFKKQILFKQDDGSYYNQRLDESMSKSDVKEWLLAEVGELCNDD